MANIDYLRKKVEFHVRDVKVTEDQLNELIVTVLEDIATDTKIFKKIYGFTVHEELELYNFRYIARMNEQVEEEPTNITFSAPTNKKLLKFLEDATIPSPTTEKTLVIEPGQSRLLDVLDVYDEVGRSVLDAFTEKGSSYYYCYNEEWRKINDDKVFAFVGWVVPDITELADEQLLDITQTVIAGVKFYVMDSLHGPTDVQATNYDYMRYFSKKQELSDRYPTAVISTTTYTRDAQWL